MKFFRFLSFTSLLCLCSTMAFSAFGTEQIRFDNNVSRRAQQNIHQYTEANRQQIPGITSENLRIAKTDLNRDGIDEFIISALDCASKKAACPFLILADKDRSVLPLGHIKARYIALADTYSHGIRDIQIYDNEKNDFDYKLYTWEPASSHYTIAGEKQ